MKTISKSLLLSFIVVATVSPVLAKQEPGSSMTRSEFQDLDKRVKDTTDAVADGDTPRNKIIQGKDLQRNN